MSLDIPTGIIQNQVAYTKDGNYNNNLSSNWPSILPPAETGFFGGFLGSSGSIVGFSI